MRRPPEVGRAVRDGIVAPGGGPSRAVLTARRGRGDDPAARVRAAMLTAAISGAAKHPLVAEQDEVVLRSELLHLAQRFLDLPSRRRHRQATKRARH